MDSSDTLRALLLALVLLALPDMAATQERVSYAQGRDDCIAMSKEVESAFTQPDVCAMQEDAISALADRWLKIRLNVCREAPSFYDEGLTTSISCSGRARRIGCRLVERCSIKGSPPDPRRSMS